jgi:hypothetical protein
VVQIRVLSVWACSFLSSCMYGSSVQRCIVSACSSDDNVTCETFSIRESSTLHHTTDAAHCTIHSLIPSAAFISSYKQWHASARLNCHYQTITQNEDWSMCYIRIYTYYISTVYIRMWYFGKYLSHSLKTQLIRIDFESRDANRSFVHKGSWSVYTKSDMIKTERIAVRDPRTQLGYYSAQKYRVDLRNCV